MAGVIQQSHPLAYLQNPNTNYFTSQTEFCRYYDVIDNFSVKQRRLLSATAKDEDRRGRLRSGSEKTEYVEETRQNVCK
jgi:hypothetical protein